MNKSEYSRDVIRSNRRFESLYFSKVLKAIQFKINQVIDILHSSGIEAAQRHLHQDTGNTKLTAVVNDIYQSVGLRGANRTAVMLRSEKRLGYNPQWARIITDYLKLFLLDKVTHAVNETTRDHMLRVLDEAIANGWGEFEITNRLKDQFARYQAARIVRTEVGRANEVGAYAASQTFGFEQNKVWIAIKDNRTRGNPQTGDSDHADHFDMDGQTVGSNSSFIDPRSGERLKFPKDPEAGPGDTINCRCTTMYAARRDERGRLIPKKQLIQQV